MRFIGDPTLYFPIGVLIFFWGLVSVHRDHNPDTILEHLSDTGPSKVFVEHDPGSLLFPGVRLCKYRGVVAEFPVVVTLGERVVL